MQPEQLDEGDVGKDVVGADGNVVGEISTIDHGTVYVDPNPGLIKRETAALGWNDIDDEYGYPLQEEAVETVTEGDVRLSSNL